MHDTLRRYDRRDERTCIDSFDRGHRERIARGDAEPIVRVDQRGLSDRREPDPAAHQPRHDVARIDAVGELGCDRGRYAAVELPRRQDEQICRESIAAEMRRFPDAPGSDAFERLGDRPSA